MMPRRNQKHRRMVVVLVIVILAVAGITKRRHTQHDAEVPS
jgi:hypothetical protein